MMRPAGLAVWKAQQLIHEVARPGVTTAEIDEVVRAFFEKIDAEPLFLNYPNSSAGRPKFPGVTCTSINEQVVHGIPGPRKLVEGDVISIDTGCRMHGWCGDAAVTLPIGEVQPEVQRLLDVTAEVLVLAINLIPKKAKWSEVASEMDAFVKDAGFSTVESFVGHGIGQKMHEPPQVPNYVAKKLRAKDDFRLDPGLVLAIEPMVNMGQKNVVAEPDFWTMSTADGKPSAHFEHTVAITEHGVRVLTAPPVDEQDEQIVQSF
ncbi:MAG: type I methionyl aminopeptidase [Planctomycetales bacterium]|nr:type I methionyl aminopeptidase [Planctomycetales bacterium]NIM07579.1 type I methionyl aminopeptidase [Planctomycetales bacterium]NIN07085.1 type I methionyl aminopeptidase [Planctomycetales bacterium]NIN76179.1 type I methionyl aminopeptidase [Planctomycetales bacterium]NIO33401.1 type I methionyl aminopeptidase [Planctomycetales bacterium]